jgi:pimeloyl-ACP methyl ester carboxylesterase
LRINVERLLAQGGGAAAQAIEGAETDRWVALMSARSRASELIGQIPAYRASPELYKQIRMLNEFGPNRLVSEPRIMRLRALEREPDTAASKESLAAMPMPVLFVGGEHDEVMPVSLMEIAHGLIPSSDMVVVPGTAHSVHFEAPEIFNHIALEFFKASIEIFVEIRIYFFKVAHDVFLF